MSQSLFFVSLGFPSLLGLGVSTSFFLQSKLRAAKSKRTAAIAPPARGI